MLTIASLLKLAFSLGLTVTLQQVPDDGFVVKYYNEDLDRIVDCTPVTTDIGKASVCEMTPTTYVVYIIKE